MFKSIWRSLTQLGPAFVLAAVVLGPGSITLSTVAGSVYGYRLLWVVTLATAFMIVFTSISARIGLASGKTLLQLTAQKYGRGVAIVGGAFGFLSILAFQAGNSAAVGFSGNVVFGLDSRLWTLVFFIPALVMLHLPGLYRKLEHFVKAIVGLMIVSFAGTLTVVGIDFTKLPGGLVPGLPDAESGFLALGMVATTFSIAAAAYQSYLMQEKRWTRKDSRKQGVDTLLGIALLGLISGLILLTSAGVAGTPGGKAFTAQTMVFQLEPLAGPFAFLFFMAGFFCAAFSSLVVNPLIGATLLVDGLGMDCTMGGKAVRAMASLIMLAGAVLVGVYGEAPIELLRTAQALAVVAFPILAFLVWSLGRDRSLLGDLASPWWLNVLGGLGYFMVLAVVLNYVRQILGSL